MNVLQERVLELEYVKVVAPREQEEPCPHDDWVSAVDGSNPRYGLCLVACAQPDICGNNLSGLECLFFCYSSKHVYCLDDPGFNSEFDRCALVL